MTTQTTQIHIGDGVILQIDSWDQLPQETRQQLRKLAMEMLEVCRPHNVAIVQMAPKANLRVAQK